MVMRDFDTLWDRKTYISIKENFKELFNYYIKSGLDAAEAREKAIQAVADAEIAKDIAETTREEMLAIIREQTQNGDLAPEIAQARQGKATLGDNLNSIKSDLAQTAEHDMNIVLITDIHYSAIGYGGLTPDERAQFMVDELNREHDENPVDMVFFLGDLSSNEPEGYTEKLIIDYLYKLKMPYFCLNGNHDLISDGNWEKLLGYKKNYSFSFGDNAFVVLDTFSGPVNPNNTAYGQTYSLVDIEWAYRELNKFKDKNIFILCHALRDYQDVDFSNLIINNPNVVAVFQGHRHDDNISAVLDSEIPLITCGQFSYPLNDDAEKNVGWGYRRLYTNSGEIITDKVYVEREYPEFYQPHEVTDEILLKTDQETPRLNIKDTEHLVLMNLFSKVSSVFEKTDEKVTNTSKIPQHPSGGILSVINNTSYHIDSLYHTGMYYVNNSNGMPDTGYLIVTGYSRNNFTQIFIPQFKLNNHYILVRSRSSGSEISDWSRFEQQKDVSKIFSIQDEFSAISNSPIVAQRNGRFIIISGRVEGIFRSGFVNNRIIKIDSEYIPGNFYYGSATLMTTSNNPEGSATIRTSRDGFIEVSVEEQYEGAISFILQYVI